MSYLLDTNILLRWQRTQDAQSSVAKNAITLLAQRGQDVFVATPSLHEFWYVSTRAVAKNGYGLSSGEANAQLQRIETIFYVLPEDPRVYPLWHDLVVRHHITGLQIFDVRLIAVMKAFQSDQILTFNVSDFVPLVSEGFEVADPSSIV